MFRDETGAMLVEMALVFPVVLLMTFGSLDLGLYQYYSNAAAKAAQMGARWAAVNAPISSAFATDLASTAWWPAGSLGQSCTAVSGGCQPVQNDAKYTCTGGAAGCNFSAILPVMQAAYPQLQAADVKITYRPYPTASQLGFVGRPGGPPVDIVVTVCRKIDFVFLSTWFGWAAPTPATGSPCAGRAAGWYTPAVTRLSSESFGAPT